MDYIDSDIDDFATPVMPSPYNNAVDHLDSVQCVPHSWKPPSHHLRKIKSKQEKKMEVNFNIGDCGDKSLHEENFNAVYEELQIISEKLKDENQKLYEREQALNERERMLSISQSNIQTITDHQTRQQVASIEQKYLNEISMLEQTLKERQKEIKRLKENFETMKQANDALKNENCSIFDQHEKLLKQNNSLQARLSNLLKKNEYSQRQKDEELNVMHSINANLKVHCNVKDSKESNNKDVKKKSTKLVHAPVHDIISVLLDWICEANLRLCITDSPTHPVEKYNSIDFMQEKIIRLLPSFVDFLHGSCLNSVKSSLPCLQFIYWSILVIEQGSSQQKSSLSSTLRRLGEEVYHPVGVRVAHGARSYRSDVAAISAPRSCPDTRFFCSQSQHIRLISCVIILKTLSQADILAHAFDTLKAELKEEVGKELFLYYQATPVITHFLKPTNKVFMSPALDIFLQMSSDSSFQAAFLDSCSNESFFRTAAMVIRTPLSDSRVMERLSIVLQKLSKIRSNRKFFDVYTIVSIIQELLRNCKNENAFLALNLKSILINLNTNTG